MTDSGSPPTTTQLLAEASRLLEEGGYRAAQGYPDWVSGSSRLYEDEYNIVGLVVFSTCAELLKAWPDLQASLVEVMSRTIGQGEAKSWDGYLVLVTPGIAPTEAVELESVRQNTNRLRKLVATGEILSTTFDIARVLKPLLPLKDFQSAATGASALDGLPALLAKKGIPEDTTYALVRAFESQQPLVEAMHKQREQSE
jgi:hypothetical protein